MIEDANGFRGVDLWSSGRVVCPGMGVRDQKAKDSPIR